MPVEDVKFMKIMEDGAKMVNKHYQIPLPFRNPNNQLPNNRYQAWQRLSYLQERFNKNKEFEKDYVRFMEETISKGYARKSTREAAPNMVFINQISLERSGQYLTSVQITWADVSIENFYLDQTSQSNSWCPTAVQRRTSGSNGGHRSNVSSGKGP